MKKIFYLFFVFCSITFSYYEEFPIDKETIHYKTPWGGDEYIEHIGKIKKFGKKEKEVREKIYEKIYSGNAITERIKDVDTINLKIFQYGVIRNDEYITDLPPIPTLRKKGILAPFKKENREKKSGYKIYYVLNTKVKEDENGVSKYYPSGNLAEENLEYYEGEDKKKIYREYDEAENIIYEVIKINDKEIKRFSSKDKYEKLKEKDLCEIYYPNGKKAYEKKLVLEPKLKEKIIQEKYYNKEGVLLYESETPLFEIIDFSSKVLKRYDKLYGAGNPFLQKIKKYRENGDMLYEENFKIEGENIIFAKKSYFEDGNIFYDEQEIINRKEYFKGLSGKVEDKSINSKYFLKRYDENKNIRYLEEWDGEKATRKYFDENNTLIKEEIESQDNKEVIYAED